MSAVSTGRKKFAKDEALTRKIPENPKYRNVKSVIDTGATSKKFSQQRPKEALKKYDEVFKRIKLSTFVSLAVEVSREEMNRLSPKQIKEFEPRTMISKEEAPSSLHSVINGIGETDLKKQPSETRSATDDAYVAPYLLLDVRDQDAFQQCHILTAKNYPSSMLCRSCNYESKELLAYKNVPLCIIVLYDEDETVASKAAATLTQRGYDNIFMLSGGLKLAATKFPDGLVTGDWPESCVKVATKKKALKSDFSLVKKRAGNKFTQDDLDKLQLELHRCFISQTETNSQTIQSRATTARSTASRATSVGRIKPWK